MKLAIILAILLPMGVAAQNAAAPADQATVVPCVDSADYQAVQSGDKTYIFAKVVLNTSGWTVSFIQSPEKIFPPQFILSCVKPSGQAEQTISTYTTDVAVPGKHLGRNLIVHDAKGSHTIKVWMKLPES